MSEPALLQLMRLRLQQGCPTALQELLPANFCVALAPPWRRRYQMRRCAPSDPDLRRIVTPGTQAWPVGCTTLSTAHTQLKVAERPTGQELGLARTCKARNGEGLRPRNWRLAPLALQRGTKGGAEPLNR